MRINNYAIWKQNNRTWIMTPRGNCSPVVFYYTPEETKKYHRQNLKFGWSFHNEVTGVYKQLIGLHFDLKNRSVYRRLINAYIKDEIDWTEPDF